MKRKFYAAYGSNLNVEQMNIRCPTAQIVGTSEIKDYRLLFKGSKTGSYLTIEAKKGSVVPVAVWSVTEADEKALDCYEGFPTLYYKARFKLPVKGLNGGKKRFLETFVYIMHENRPIGIPNRFYVETCLEGYRTFGFDSNFLSEALTESRKATEKGKQISNF